MSETITISPKACLFDMDGTLIDSSPAVVVAWETMKETYPFLDLDHILKSAHGYRTVDALRKWCLIDDQELLAKEVVRFEVAILEAAKARSASGADGIVSLPGVKDLLRQIGEGAEEARDGFEGWAICTSSTHFYASQAIPTAGLPMPKIFITAESVTKGKPAPDPYLLGAKRNNAEPNQCVVFEDAPTGIRSGKAAGCVVLATCTSHTRESLEKEHPDFLVEDLSHVQAKWVDGELHLTIEQPTDRASPAPTPLATPSVSRSGSQENLSEFAKAAKTGRTPVGTPAADIKGALRGMSGF
ncbi:phosphatase [Phaffia rhodozyma]|uniref:Phosphatase n=1 Tax=Phaffia rhodozyma TaxID=264483 RepID=A0A0F7SPR5_PHARH|nr:phosphatase [Phaffia rhodozyma]